MTNSQEATMTSRTYWMAGQNPYRPHSGLTPGRNAMNWRRISQSASLALGLLVLPGSATSQQKSLKEQLVGTWLYVSSTITQSDGKKTDRPGQKAIVIYTSDGHFAYVSVRGDLPKLADPARATAEEALAVVAGSIAYFGTYSVNETDKVIIAKPEGSTLANLVGGAEQKRIITSLTADELRFTNPRTPSGATLEFVWKRAK
jgi:hypothetical protein